MGLFGSIASNLGKAAVSAARTMAETGREMNQLKMEYMSYSDARLVSIARGEGLFGSGPMQKMVAMNVLKERHGAEEAARMMLRK